MTEAVLQVYGAYWCHDSRRVMGFLDERKIAYEWHDVDEDSAGLEYVRLVNHGKKILPTLLFPDGTVMAEPSIAKLSGTLGID